MKEKILCLFEELYKKKYLGKLEVKEIPGGYTLVLHLNQDEKPIRISAQGDEDTFLKIIREELRTRHFDLAEYYYGYQYYPDPGCPPKKCCCND